MKMNNKVTLISCDNLSVTGLRIISSLLKKDGFDVQLITLETLYETFSKKILNQVYELTRGSAIIGFSSTANTKNKTIHIINHLKKRLSGSLFVWGGIHATLNPDDCLRYVDVVCVGEGEGAMLDLAHALKKEKKYNNIQNLWVKTKEKTYKNEIRPLIQDLNRLPFPDYDFKNQYLLVFDKIKPMEEKYLRYGNHNISNILLFTVGKFITCHTIRGCPFNCDYCCNIDLKRIYQGKGKFIRKRSIDNVISELLDIRRRFKDLNFIWFSDDDFFIRPLHEIEYFAKVYKEKINLPFMCYVTPFSFGEQKFKHLLKAGLFTIEMGIQSGSIDFNKNIYNRNQKPTLLFKCGRVFKKYQRFFNPPVYQMLYLNPLEKEKDLLYSIKLLQKLPKPFFLTPFAIVFFPGNSLYEKKKKVLQSHMDLDKIFSNNYVNYLAHIKLKNIKTVYLNLIIRLMSGNNTNFWAGSLPRFVLNFLLKETVRSRYKNSEIVMRLLLYFPTKSNILWMLPDRFRARYLNIINSLIRKLSILKTKVTKFVNSL